MITIDLEQLTGQVCNLAKETGEFIRQERKKFRREQVEKNMHTIMCRMLTKNRKSEL